MCQVVIMEASVNKKATLKQKLLRLFYPLLMKGSKRMGDRAVVLVNKEHKLFQTPIHDLTITLNTGATVTLRQWQGKKLLLVNTASQCGYTAQYSELQQLQERYAGTLQVIGFPSNDFKNQEPDSDAAIAQFCQLNFGVTFPLVTKSQVIKGTHQHPVYQWLTQPQQNGWNDKAPSWNFSKYLINEHGVLTHYFGSGISPLGPEVTQALDA